MKERHPLVANVRKLRKDCTNVERLLWRHLKCSQIEGIKSRRQQPIEDYIVDFVSFSPKLVIELDGSQHMDDREYDKQRDACLLRNGFDVLRFWNNDVHENLEGILEVIRHRCLELATPTPQTPPARGISANIELFVPSLSRERSGVGDKSPRPLWERVRERG